MQAISTTLPQAAADADILLERQVESYWDNRSEEFSTKRRRELDGPDGAAWRRLLTQYIDGIWPDMQHLRVLDVGTGAGFFAILLAEMGAHVTGVDMSREMLHEAKENSLAYGVSSLTEFRPMNAQELDFDDASFDIVISRNLTWTLPDAAQAYREWSRVLKAGGLLLNFDSDYSQTVWTQDNTGDELADATLAECTAIKNAMSINEEARPTWDMAQLQSLGLTVRLQADIRPQVHLDPLLIFDAQPLFALCAQK